MTSRQRCSAPATRAIDAAGPACPCSRPPRSGAKKTLEKWNKFVKSYNRPMKEGLYTDYANRDEIDDIVIPSYNKYKDWELKAVNRAGSDDELGVDKDEAKKKEEAFKPVQKKIKKALGDRVKDVVLSKRLSDSPSCVVIDENDPSIQMERMMKAMGQGNQSLVKPILEINGDHALVKKLEGPVADDFVAQVSEVLLDQALLISGAELKDPADFVKAMNSLLSK